MQALPSWPYSRPAVCGHAVKATPMQVQQPTSLLNWLVENQGATPSQLKIERAFLGDYRGWGLLAADDVEGDEVLLSVPLTAAVSSRADNWSVDMAGQFLRQDQGGAQAPLAPWVASLPRHVPLPWLHWSEAEVAELQDGAIVEEATRLRQVLEGACEANPGVDRGCMAWALSLVYSRSFVDRGAHVCVPGIDMCNHSRAPNAGVRCVHSPDACQGAAAAEEIAPPRPPSPSLFELVAGDAGIKAGEEVTISYGRWPSDVFLLFFGWVDAGNPHDASALLPDVLGLTTFDQRMQLSAAAATTPALLQAAEAVVRSRGGGLTVPQFFGQRCQELLAAFPTTAEQDEALLKGGVGGSKRLQEAVRFRLGKKRALLALLDSLGAA